MFVDAAAVEFILFMPLSVVCFVMVFILFLPEGRWRGAAATFTKWHVLPHILVLQNLSKYTVLN